MPVTILPPRFFGSPMPHSRLSVARQIGHFGVLAAALSCLLFTRLPAQLAFERNFNGPDTIWKLVDNGTPATILSQDSLAAGARDQAGSERIVAAAPAGESLLLEAPIARVAVLPELQIRLWVKSDRPSVQLAAKVALPRSSDPGSGLPATAIVRGATYTQPGHWQQLTLTDIPELLAARIRVMRTTPGAAIDARQAFVNAVLLVIPGEPQGVEVLTDELEVDGVLLANAEQIQLTSHPAAAPPAAAVREATAVRLHGDLLLVDDRPFVPRVIEWQGEPLAFLAERGFNAVKLPGRPTDEQISEAQRHGLWFVCLAPRPQALTRDAIGRSGDRILAWLLDDEAIEADPNYAYRWVELVRQRDAVAGRPILMAPDIDWTAAGKSADILAARHPVLSRVSSADFDRWLADRPRWMRPGTPLWATFATQFGEAAQQQIATLSASALVPPAIDASQLDSLVRTACTRSVRGFIFQSDSSLSEPDAATRARAAALELINRRLQLIEPWLAGGKVIGRVASSDGAWTGVVLHVDRARLLVPLPAAADETASQVSTPTAPRTTSDVMFLVPGIPESSQGYAFSAAALRTLPLQRVAGGTRVVLPSAADALAVITEDPQVINSLRQRIHRDGAQVVRLRRDLAAQRTTLMANTAARLTQLGHNNDAAARGGAAVNAQLRQVDVLLAGGRLEPAFELLSSVDSLLEQLATDARRSIAAPRAFESNPLALSYEQLADYAAFQQSCDAFRSGDNVLYGGDFEDLGQMTQFGWRHFQNPLPGVQSLVELSATEPKHGRYCLRLQSTATATNPDLVVDERATVWVVSPPVPVVDGQLIEISGWVRVDERIDGQGLAIIDSLGGPELSLAIGETSDWQPFHM
ncbi:MAG: hypothetical protein WD229_10910, partial [Pirellulales bacterium]